MYSGKKVVVAGGTGTIGIPLVLQLLAQKADVTVVALDLPRHAKAAFGGNVKFHCADLTDYDACVKATHGQDYVFNLVGIKGSTGIGETKVASYLVPMLRFQTNLMEAAFKNNVQRYMFVGSICSYPKMSVPKSEDSMWDGQPKQNDRIPGLAKRIGEVQGEAYMLEYGWDAVRIVRPSNVYGPYDDFNPKSAQVIPALITRVLGDENPLTVWGDGSAVRDFIYSEDVAYWMLKAMETAPPCVPINLGSGVGYTIKELAETIVRCAGKSLKIQWDVSKPTGDGVRILSMERAKKMLGFMPRTNLEEGIRKTISWYLEREK